MTLDQLRYALALQQTKNFSRAAESCHITQPSLSIQIAKLEEELGLTLFDRSRAGVLVTEYGQELLRQARVVLDESERLGQISQELRGEVQGRFRLGIIPTLAPSLLPIFLGTFQRKYPKVMLAITEEPTSRLVAALDDGSLDGALLSTPAECPDSLIEKVLFYEPFVVFSSTKNPILEHKMVRAEHISSSEILLLDDTHCLRDQVLQLCKAREKSTDQRLRIQTASLMTLIEFIRRENGYTLLPGLSTQFLTPTERTKNIRQFEKPVPSRKVSLVFHRAHLKRSIIEALKVAILESLPDSVFVNSTAKGLRVMSPGAEHFEL